MTATRQSWRTTDGKENATVDENWTASTLAGCLTCLFSVVKPIASSKQLCRLQSWMKRNAMRNKALLLPECLQPI